MNNPSITIEELSVLCSITPDGVKWNLRKLKNQKLIRRVGSDKGGYREVVTEEN